MFQCLSILLASAFGKDSERRAQRQTENEVFGLLCRAESYLRLKVKVVKGERRDKYENKVFTFGYAEPQSIFDVSQRLCKRAQKQNFCFDYAECSLFSTLVKDCPQTQPILPPFLNEDKDKKK